MPVHWITDTLDTVRAASGGKEKTLADHSLGAELKRVAEAAIAQGIETIQPGETRTLDLSAESIYAHIPVGVNILSITVQRPEAKK